MNELISVTEHRFDNADGCAAALRDAGFSEIIFSLDGLHELHDAYRRCTGLYDRIICAVAAARAGSIRCSVSIVFRDMLEKNDRFFQDVMRILELFDNPRVMERTGKKDIRVGVQKEPEYDFGNASKSIAERHSAANAIDWLVELQDIRPPNSVDNKFRPISVYQAQYA